MDEEARRFLRARRSLELLRGCVALRFVCAWSSLLGRVSGEVDAEAEAEVEVEVRLIVG